MMSAVPQVNYYQDGDDDDEDQQQQQQQMQQQQQQQHQQQQQQQHGSRSPMQQRSIKKQQQVGHVIGSSASGTGGKQSLGAELDMFLHRGNNNNSNGHNSNSNGGPVGSPGGGGHPGLQRSCSGSVATSASRHSAMSNASAGGYSCSQMSTDQMSAVSAVTVSSTQSSLSMVSGCSQSVAAQSIDGASQPAPPPQVPLGDYDLADLARKAQKSCQRKFAHSPSSDVAYAKLAHMAQFDYDYEVQVGEVLGQGQFGVVSEVKAILMRRQSHSDYDQQMFDREQVRERELVASRTVRREGSRGEGDSRYAVKVLRKQQCCDKLHFYNAYRDMAIEIHLLAALDHRHILKLRGISSAQNTKNGGGGNDGYGSCAPAALFLLTDKLYGTLKDKYADWRIMHKKLSKRLSGFKKIVGGSKAAAELKERKRHLLEARLRVLRDAASAIQYMHQRGIIQRDLKPDNVGFDVRGDVKIFDFGLSTEVPPVEEAVYRSERNDLCLYQLTGMTGSLRYMAPENYNHQPYNESIDIYALSIIVWQTMTLQHLYPNHDKQMIIELVVQRGNRPDLHGALALTESMQKLLKNMWSVNVGNRPPAKYVLTKLQRELALVKEAKQLIQVQEQEDHNEEAEDTSSIVAREVHNRRRAAEATRQRTREQGPQSPPLQQVLEATTRERDRDRERERTAQPVDDLIMLKKHQAQRQLRQSRRDDLLSNIDKALDIGGNTSGNGNNGAGGQGTTERLGNSREVQRMLKEKYQGRNESHSATNSRRTVSTRSTNSYTGEGDDSYSDRPPA
jgi:serine/threonine protein kinase